MSEAIVSALFIQYKLKKASIERYSTQLKLLINIAAADLFILGTGWVKIKKYLLYGHEGDNWMGQDGTLCKLYYGANQVCMISSITVIAAMSLDRLGFILYIL